MAGKEYRNMGKTECEDAGKVWVEAHMRSMTYVHGYCRDRTKEEIEKMSLEERREFDKKSPDLNQYYEGKGPDPLEAISEILREMDLPENGGVDEIEYELPGGKYTTSEEEVEKVGSAEFSTTLYKNGRLYGFAGTIYKKNGNWVAGGETDELEIR